MTARKKVPTNEAAEKPAETTAPAVYPNLAGVATANLIEKIKAGTFQASYINWSRTMNLLRIHAPGWLPETVLCPNGELVHRCPNGGLLMISFVHADGRRTPPMPQAIMDNNNKAIPYANITARDITDSHRRGLCMAAAMTFGLAYELWAKVALESGYGEKAEAAAQAKETTLAAPLADYLTLMADAKDVIELMALFGEAWTAYPDHDTREVLKANYDEAKARLAGESE